MTRYAWLKMTAATFTLVVLFTSDFTMFDFNRIPKVLFAAIVVVSGFVWPAYILHVVGTSQCRQRYGPDAGRGLFGTRMRPTPEPAGRTLLRRTKPATLATVGLVMMVAIIEIRDWSSSRSATVWTGVSVMGVVAGLALAWTRIRRSTGATRQASLAIFLGFACLAGLAVPLTAQAQSSQRIRTAETKPVEVPLRALAQAYGRGAGNAYPPRVLLASADEADPALIVLILDSDPHVRRGALRICRQATNRRVISDESIVAISVVAPEIAKLAVDPVTTAADREALRGGFRLLHRAWPHTRPAILGIAAKTPDPDLAEMALEVVDHRRYAGPLTGAERQCVLEALPRFLPLAHRRLGLSSPLAHACLEELEGDTAARSRILDLTTDKVSSSAAVMAMVRWKTRPTASELLRAASAADAESLKLLDSLFWTHGVGNRHILHTALSGSDPIQKLGAAQLLSGPRFVPQDIALRVATELDDIPDTLRQKFGRDTATQHGHENALWTLTFAASGDSKESQGARRLLQWAGPYIKPQPDIVDACPIQSEPKEQVWHHGDVPRSVSLMQTDALTWTGRTTAIALAVIACGGFVRHRWYANGRTPA